MVLTSVWESASDRAPVSSELPAGRFDVAVVGGGLTGLATSLLLARAGREVVLVEARRLGSGTTGRSTAKLSLLQGSRLAEIRSRQGPAALRSYVDANNEAQAWVVRFAADHDVDVERRPDYSYANGEAGRRRLRHVLAAATEAGLAAEWVDEVPLPFPSRGAVRVDDQLQLDPLQLVRALADAAVAHGVRIVEGRRVHGVDGRGPVRLRLADGAELEADRVVIATGMPILDRGAFFARMTPSRSYSVAFRTAEPAVEGMFLSVDAPSRSIRTAPGSDGCPLLLVGGNGHPTGRARSTERRLDELRDWTAEHFPDAVETHAWSAQDYVTHHSLPYAGPALPGSDHVLVAGGFAKWGMTSGVAAALALSGQILGGHQPWASAFRTWSAREVRGLGHGVVENGKVGARMTLGWLAPLGHPTSKPAAPGQGLVELDGLVRTPVATSTVDATERRTSAVCTHLGGIVRWNDAERSWDCPLHGSRFDADGGVLEGPATCGLTRRNPDKDGETT